MRSQRRRWWTLLVTLLTILTVIAASLSVLFRLAVDAVPGYRVELERYVAKSVGHPTRIGSMALTWSRLRPTLEVRDIALLDGAGGKPLLEANRLRLGIGLFRLLVGERRPDRVEISGLQLDADVDSTGHASLRGFDVAGADQDQASLLQDFGRFRIIRLESCRLLLHDARLGAEPAAAPLVFRLFNATIRHSGDRYEADALLDPPAALARRVSLRATLNGEAGQQISWHGDWSASVEKIAGWPWLMPSLNPGVQLVFDDAALRAAGSIEAGRIGKTTIELQAANLLARQDAKPLAQVAGLRLRASGEPGEDGAWQLQVEQLILRGARGPWSPGKTVIARAGNADGAALTASADLVRLDDLAPWVSVLRALPPSLARLRDARGDAESFQLIATPPDRDDRAEPRTRYQLSARLVGSGLTGAAAQPGFSGLDGVIEADTDGGQFRLANTPLQIQLPDSFERPVAIESVSGTLSWRRSGNDWRIAAPALVLRMLDTQVEGDASVLLASDPSTPPDLSLHLRMQSADAAALKSLMPKTWGPHTRTWLTRALLHARISGGELKIDAPMTPRAGDGRMTMPWTLDLDVADVELDYAPDWPRAIIRKGSLHFHDGGLEVDADSGEINGSRIEKITAGIADFRAADLVLDGRLSGDGGAFYRLLRESPMNRRLGGLLSRTEASGPISVDLHLQVPLHIEKPDVRASGELRFDDAQLKIRGLDEPVRALRGRLAFGGDGVRAEALAGRLYDTAITARIQPETGVPDGVLIGEFDLDPGSSKLAAAFIPAWLRKPLSGSTQLRLRMPFGGPDSGRLTLAGELRGMTSALPPPLTKDAATTLPLSLGIGGDPLRVQIRAGETLRVGLRFAGTGSDLRTRGIEVRLGEGAAPRADADGLLINGVPAVLDLGAWVGFLRAAEFADSSMPFLGADLSPERLVYRSLALGPTHLVAASVANGIAVRVDGGAVGSIDWQRGRVQARLQKLALVELPPLPSKPVEAPKDSPFDPGTAPLLDLDCTAVSLGAVDLGHLSLLTARVADGQRIEQLRLSGGKLVVDAHGAWRRRGGGSEPGSSAELSFDLNSSAIADVLSVFGYAPNLRAEEARFIGTLAWPRVPAGLELSQAQGSVQLDVRRGALKAVEPGAGRVLGLINLYALPRRLLFDFRDVTSKGLGFDTLTGNFALADGNANTSDLRIDGPSVKVKMQGRIGLAARDYDQRVTVYPDVSTGVTIGAALIGGPIGGGIALVAQQLFGKPFNRLAKFSYRVTGSWDNPEVIKGNEDAVPLAAPPPATPKSTGTGVDNG